MHTQLKQITHKKQHITHKHNEQQLKTQRNNNTIKLHKTN